MISAWEAAGVPVKQKGASYTGNMLGAFLACGFKNVTAQVNLRTGAGLQKGDVLLNVKNHTEMFIGDGKVVKASINERGGVTGGQSGDQSGREIYIGSYYNFPWDCVLRYEGDGGEEDDTSSGADAPPSPQGEGNDGGEGNGGGGKDTSSGAENGAPVAPAPAKGDYSLEFHILRRGAGMKGQESLREEVRAVQQLLEAKGYDIGSCGADGEFGGDTEAAVKAYQAEHTLEDDGEVGPETMSSLLGLIF